MCPRKDVGLHLNISKTSFLLPKGIAQQAAFDQAQNITMDKPALAVALRGNVSLAFFHPTSMSGTDAFVQNFVAKKCREIIDDVEKLDATPDGFIHYQLLRFCQATRLQYLNDNNFKITDSLLTKGTKQHADGWDASSKAWSHMVLHLPHAEGGFGVTFNDINKDSVFYTSNSRFVT